MKEKLISKLEFLFSIADRPDSTPEDKRQHRFLIHMGILMGMGGLVWGTISFVFDLCLASIIPYGYSFLTICNLSYLHFTKNFGASRFFQLLLSLLLPFLFQFVLGGFIASGAVMLWSILALLGAFTFQESKSTVTWFLGYMILVIFSGVIDSEVKSFGIDAPESISVMFFTLNIGLVSAVVFILFFYFVSSGEKLKIDLEAQKKETESLLLNILPRSIAERLKSDSHTIADGFQNTTILFADIVGFTSLSEKTSPRELVSMLNKLFSKFDHLVDEFGLEKIKTIGDAYMVAGGVPSPRDDHAEAIADLAFEMLRRLNEFNVKHNQSLNIRIGIHSGALVAGVIGVRKFVYDVWGDTVNIASRMESHGIPGRIHISEHTRQILKNKSRFKFEKRGVVEIKGKGKMTTYFLDPKKPQKL